MRRQARRLRPMLRSRVWLVTALSLTFGSALALGREGPFDAELRARRAELERLHGKAEAIVPLLGILDLWTEVGDRAAIAQALDAVIADKRQRAEVRGRA